MEYRDLKEAYRADKQTHWHDNMVDYINWLEDKIIDSQTNWISVEDWQGNKTGFTNLRDYLSSGGFDPDTFTISVNAKDDNNNS